VLKQSVSVLDQEKIDKLMLDMDGTDNKCKHINMIKGFVIIAIHLVAITECIYEMKNVIYHSSSSWFIKTLKYASIILMNVLT